MENKILITITKVRVSPVGIQFLINSNTADKQLGGLLTTGDSLYTDDVERKEQLRKTVNILQQLLFASRSNIETGENGNVEVELVFNAPDRIKTVVTYKGKTDSNENLGSMEVHAPYFREKATETDEKFFFDALYELYSRMKNNF